MRRTVPAIALLFVVACSGTEPAPVLALHSGGLLYEARSADGRPAVRGRIDLQIHDDSTVSGSWEFAWAPGADTTEPVGPQVGSGSLVGSVQGDRLHLSLNPDVADNNVFLHAAATPAGARGTWEWSGLAGVLRSGTFVITSEPDR